MDANIKAYQKYQKNLINLIYKVNDVQAGYFFYQSKLLDIVNDLIIYHDLDMSYSDEDMSSEIEYRRITYGYCSIVKHPKYGCIPCDSSLFNYDIFGNYKNILFFNPYKTFILDLRHPQPYEINKDAIVIYSTSHEKKNNYPYQGRDIIIQQINRYARELADIDSTINLYTINSRQPYIITTRNQQTHASLVDIFKRLRKGELYIALDKDIVKEATSLKNMDINPGYITELIESKKSILKEFLNQWGIPTMDDKKERMITTEAETEVEKVKVYINSFLKEAKRGIKNYNTLFNKNAWCELNPEIYNNEYNLDIEEIEEIEDIQEDNIHENQ